MLNLNLLCPKVDPAPRPGSLVVHLATGQRAVLLRRSYGVARTTRNCYAVDTGDGGETFWRGITITAAEPPHTDGLHSGLSRYFRWPSGFERWPNRFYERQRWAKDLDDMDRMAQPEWRDLDAY